MKTFTAQIQGAGKNIERKMLRVAVAAIQDVMEAAQTPQTAISKGATSFEPGKIPVADKALIQSLRSDGIQGEASYVTALAGLKIGEVMRFTWGGAGVDYAMRIEHGFTGTDSLGRNYNQAGRFFVGDNAARFSQFVAAREKEIMG